AGNQWPPGRRPAPPPPLRFSSTMHSSSSQRNADMARRDAAHSKREEFDDVWADDDEGPSPSDVAHRRQKLRRPVIEMIYQDDDVVRVDKPAGLRSGGEESAPDTVLDQLAERLNVRDDELAVLEHMAEGVSGILLVARSALARREMPRQFAREEIEKTY